jgi:hypothetical protein
VLLPDEIAIRMLAHRQNIARFKALLKTELATVERDFIERRIAEEEIEVVRLRGENRPPRPLWLAFADRTSLC